MLYFVVWQVGHRNKLFKSAYFTLYILLSTVEILHAILISFITRLIDAAVFLDFWESNKVYPHVAYLLDAYFSHTQCFLHVAIAANRLTVFSFPLSYSQVWNQRNFLVVLFSCFVVPFLLMAYLFTGHAEHFYVGPNQLANAFVEPEVELYAGITAASVSILSSVACAVMVTWSLLSFLRIKNRQGIVLAERHDRHLLFCTAVMLASQSIVTAYHGTMIYGTTMNDTDAVAYAMNHIQWVFDQFCLLTPFCLLASSSVVRHGFIRFYLCRRQNSLSYVRQSTSLQGSNFITPVS